MEKIMLYRDKNGNIRCTFRGMDMAVEDLNTKDSTPGCTAEACNLRDNYQSFMARGYQVFGVSKDSQASHVKFKEKYNLPFPLLSDPTTEMLQAFGAWGEKKLYGKSSMGTLRKTFIFDENGILERIIEKVDTKNHTAQIL